MHAPQRFWPAEKSLYKFTLTKALFSDQRECNELLGDENQTLHHRKAGDLNLAGTVSDPLGQ